MCKANKIQKVENLCNILSQKYPYREKEFSDFKNWFSSIDGLSPDAPIYQQVIFIIFGPNYPSNPINEDEILKLIDNVAEDCIKEKLKKELEKLVDIQKTMHEYQDSTPENCKHKRDNDNAEFKKNINSLNTNNLSHKEIQNFSSGCSDTSLN